LSDTRWNVYNAIKLIKLNKLLNTGLADEQLCKQALMACGWNVEEAAACLLSPLPSVS
jgi:UBA/TS-N domain